ASRQIDSRLVVCPKFRSGTDDTPQVVTVLLTPTTRGVPPCTSKIDHPGISFRKLCDRRWEVHRINRRRQIRVSGSLFIKKIFQRRNLDLLPVSRGNLFFSHSDPSQRD